MSITTPDKYRRTADYEPEGESLTEQAHVASCDIHNIMARYEKTGIIEHLAKSQAFYDDVSNVPSFQEAMNHVAYVNEVFATLPAKVRDAFDNDPQKYLEWAQDPDVIAEFEKSTRDAAEALEATYQAPATPPAAPPPESPTE